MDGAVKLEAQGPRPGCRRLMPWSGAVGQPVCSATRTCGRVEALLGQQLVPGAVGGTGRINKHCSVSDFTSTPTLWHWHLRCELAWRKQFLLLQKTWKGYHLLQKKHLLAVQI